MPKTVHTIVNDNDLFDDNFLANCREEMEGEYLFRLLKPYAEDYFDHLPYGITDSMITHHTTRLGDYVAQIYGYRIPRQKQMEIVYNK